MRLFVALDIEEAIRERMVRFMEGVRNFAPDARWVRPESLHVTLKFIGEKPSEAARKIIDALSQVRADPIDISHRGYGFFPSPKAPRIFWTGIEAGPELARLAAAVENALLPLGIQKEEHGFSPHLTLARAGRSSAPRGPKDNLGRLTRLQEKLATVPQPDFGTMMAREFFLYESKLSPGGSRYTKLERFPLGLNS